MSSTFLGFLKVDTFGLSLLNVLTDALKLFGLNINDIRGYANGSNMKGKHQSVQKMIIDINQGYYICHVIAIISILLFAIWTNLVGRLLHFWNCSMHIHVFFCSTQSGMFCFHMFLFNYETIVQQSRV